MSVLICPPFTGYTVALYGVKILSLPWAWQGCRPILYIQLSCDAWRTVLFSYRKEGARVCSEATEGLGACRAATCLVANKINSVSAAMFLSEAHR